jgi:hypothetical protein
VPLSKTGAELLFEMLSQRYERGSTLITQTCPSRNGPKCSTPNDSPVLYSIGSPITSKYWK